jgi:transcription termination factor Rho
MLTAKTKTFLWAAARNVENGGSLASLRCINRNWFKMDEVILKNLKELVNMELQLDRKLLTNVFSH